MPNCFQLIDLQTKEPASFVRIDDDLRVHFKQPPDAKKYLYGWYDNIGQLLAFGRTWKQIRESYAGDDELLAVIGWLEERYTPNSWYESKQ